MATYKSLAPKVATVSAGGNSTTSDATGAYTIWGLTPGTYTVTWNAKGMASGVYFYQLRAGGQVMTKKMILIR